MRRRFARALAVSVLAVAGVVAAFGVVAAEGGRGASSAAPDLVGEWHLDDFQPVSGTHSVQTPDSSGNDANAIVAGPTAVSGRFGSALEFSDANRQAAVVSQAGAVGPNQLTVLAWVRRSGSPGQYRYVVAKGARQCTAASYALYTGASGGLAFYIDDGSEALVSPDAGQGVWDGSWHLVAGTFDGSKVRLFVDGNQVGSGTKAQTSIAYGQADPSSLVFGNYPQGSCGSSFGFSGDLDEVRVYSRALSGDELTYLATAGGPPAPELPAPAANASTTAPTSTTAGTSTKPTTPTPPAPPPPNPKGPIPLVRTLPAGMGGQAVFDASGSSPNGTTLASYGYHLVAGGRTYDFSCGALTPVATVSFSGAASGQVTMTAHATTGASASASTQFSASARSRARSTAAVGTGVLTSHVCARSKIPVVSKVSRWPKGHMAPFCPSDQPAVRVHAGVVDAELCDVYEATTPGVVPIKDQALLRRNLAAPAAGGKSGTQEFYVTFRTARINGLIVKPAPGAAIVIADAGPNATGWLRNNTAFVISSDATIYYTTNGATERDADLLVGPTSAVPLNWNQFSGTNLDFAGCLKASCFENGPQGILPHPGGPFDFDVGFTPYCVYSGQCSNRTQVAVPIATFNVGHYFNTLPFPAIPISGVKLTGTLGATFTYTHGADRSGAGDTWETDLTDVSLTVPLTQNGANITGTVSLRADNDHGTYLDHILFAFRNGQGGDLGSIPLKELSLAYYRSGGPDLGPDGKPLSITHDPESIVGTATVDLGQVFEFANSATGNQGTLRGRLAISAHKGWSFGGGLTGEIKLVDDPEIILTEANVKYVSANDELSGNFRLGALHLARAGEVKDANGNTLPSCGVGGMYGAGWIRFSPQFDLHADSASEMLCHPMGNRSHFDLYQTEEITPGGRTVDGVAVNLGGGIDYDLGPALNIVGDVSGGLWVGDGGAWHIQVDARGKIQSTLPKPIDVLNGSYGGEAVISDAGVGFCADASNFFGSIHPGVGFKFASQEDFGATLVAAAVAPELASNWLVLRLLTGYHTDGVFDPCNIDQFRSIHGSIPGPSGFRTSAARLPAATSLTFKVPAGGPAILHLAGQSGLPRFVLHGPQRQTVDLSLGQSARGPGYLAIVLPDTNRAIVYLGTPNAGTWTITTAAGSAGIGGLELSRQLRAPAAKGSVSAAGSRRTLHYAIRNLPSGARLTFVERGPDGGFVTLGHSSRPTGTLTFTPPMLRSGKDAILALPQTSSGMHLPAIAVARFTSSMPPIGRATAIAAVRSGHTLTITFRPAPLALRQIVVAQLSDGKRVSTTVGGHGTTVVVRGLAPAAHLVSVSVRGARNGALGPIVTFTPPTKKGA